MTDEEIKKIFEEMVKMFGDNLPNPQHQPKVFDYYLKLYFHSKKHGY